MVEDDNEIVWFLPRSRNTDFGVVTVYTGIAIIIMSLLSTVFYWDGFQAVLYLLVMIPIGIAFILYGSVLVVRSDAHGDRLVPQQDSTTGESPHGYYGRGANRGNAYEYSPMYPDSTFKSPYDAYTDHTYTYPPKPTGRPEPGRCVECGGKLFLGRANCPHCGTPVSHLDLNDG